jgi:GTP-binding protein Era
MSEKGPFRSGFVGLIGRPNSGKSTLLNTVLGERLSLVSSLPQTTRSDLKGIYSAPGLQLIFVDTPGIHEGKHALNRSISRTSLTVLTDGSLDVACYLVDMAREFGEEENFIAGHIQAASSAVLLVFNKADMVENAEERLCLPQWRPSPRRSFWVRSFR